MKTDSHFRLRSAAAILLTCLLVLTLAAPAAIVSADAGTENGAAENGGDRSEFVADFEAGISNDDPDWDLLYTAYSKEGKLTGFALSESGVYGIGFRHKTPGNGVAALAFKLSVPAPEDNKNAYVEIALRLNDYTDGKAEKKGFRICVDGAGQFGLIASSGKRFTAQQTKYTFAEGRMIYVEDDADANIVTVYVDDAGAKVKAAECVVNGQTVTMSFADGGPAPIKVDYGYEIYRDGYISITTGAKDMAVSELSVTLPGYYAASDDDPEATTDASANEPARNAGKKRVNAKLIIYGIAAAVLLAAVIVLGVMLGKTAKRLHDGEKAVQNE